MKSLRERLFDRVASCPDSGCACLLWLGYKNPNGYGRIQVNDRSRPVHRVAWELERGPIPEGMVLDHVRARGCVHRNCVNVIHLEPVTIRENLLRGDTIPAARAAKTHCVRGHLFDEANTYRHHSRGERRCRTCNRDRMRQQRRRLRLAATAA